MITVKRLSVTYEEITDENFYKWLKETYESVGDNLNHIETIHYYLEEEWEGTNYASDWDYNTKVEILGLSDEQILKMIKKIAKEVALEQKNEN